MSYRLNLIPLLAIKTFSLATYFVARIFDGEPTVGSSWQLVPGPGAPGAPESAEEPLLPPDYDASENNRKWVKVGGG